MPRRHNCSPYDLFGPLLATVQERGILVDGKTFVDARPKRSIPGIMADFAGFTGDDLALMRFVLANFDLPSLPDAPVHTLPDTPLRTHIRAMWANLARDPQRDAVGCSVLPVGHRHVVPGGRFREIYYWDSFFTMLGLMRDGEIALAAGIVDTMTDLIEEYGYVPNGSRTYYIGRSQPPLFHMMVSLLGDVRPQAAARRLAAMKREHGWWMVGGDELAPGECTNHVVRLADGCLLNRYWDARDTPRDESWREDVDVASKSGRPHASVYRDLRAGAESGWDFSSRWLDVGGAAGSILSSIRTTMIIPIDLNSFLYSLECALSASGDSDAPIYAKRASERREAIHKHLWHEEGGYFADYDLASRTVRPGATAAALVPLLCGLATDQQADATARLTRDTLLAPGGLRTTLVETGQQWDSPNGWAPLQWIAVTGLRQYGFGDLARDIATRWVATVDATYSRTGLLHEKYNVEAPEVGGGGEYEPQIGFGWTNGVTADLIDRYRIDTMRP